MIQARGRQAQGSDDRRLALAELRKGGLSATAGRWEYPGSHRACPATVVVMPSDCGVFRVKEASVWTRKQELRQARDDQAAEAECHTEAESCFQKLPPAPMAGSGDGAQSA